MRTYPAQCVVQFLLCRTVALILQGTQTEDYQQNKTRWMRHKLRGKQRDNVTDDKKHAELLSHGD